MKWHLSAMPNVSVLSTHALLSGVITVISAARPKRGFRCLTLMCCVQGHQNRRPACAPRAANLIRGSVIAGCVGRSSVVCEERADQLTSSRCPFLLALSLQNNMKVCLKCHAVTAGMWWERIQFLQTMKMQKDAGVDLTSCLASTL